MFKKKTHTPKLKYHVLNRNEWNKLISIKMHSKSKKIYVILYIPHAPAPAHAHATAIAIAIVHSVTKKNFGLALLTHLTTCFHKCMHLSLFMWWKRSTLFLSQSFTLILGFPWCIFSFFFVWSHLLFLSVLFCFLFNF